MELNAIRGGVALQRGDLERSEALYLAAMPARAAQVRMSFAAIRHRKIDAATRAMLASQLAYGPPGAGRFPVEVQAQDIDAAMATLYGTVAADSLLAPDGSGGPVRMSEGYQGTSMSILAEDWWMPQASAMRRDPRFVQFARDIGLLAFWRSNGWPDLCAPEGDAVTCR